MATVEEIQARIQQRREEVLARVGAINSGPERFGTNGRDFLTASSFSDSTLSGLGGDDRIFGRFGNDLLLGGDGNDIIDGGNGNDEILGEAGNDQLFGKFGSDFLDGGAGNDFLDGGLDDDIVEGGDGNDRLFGGPGSDQLIGGSGNDIITGGTNAGRGLPLEQDFLVGGFNAFESDGVRDIFVLGDVNGSFYTRGGFDDFALILDFESIDRIQLSPAAGSISLDFDDYSGFGIGDTAIFDNRDLIAVVVGISINDVTGSIVV